MPHVLMLLLCLLLVGACTDRQVPAPVAETLPMDGVALTLRWSVETAEGRLLGSATAFGPGRLLTNAHVVAAARGQRIVVRHGETRRAVGETRIAADADVALLHVADRDLAMPEMRLGLPGEGERLAIAGVVAGGLRVASGSALPHSVARRLGYDMLAARLPVARGYSGTPVVDAEGRLVGIVAAAAANDLVSARLLAAQARQEAPLTWVTLIVPIHLALSRFGG